MASPSFLQNLHVPQPSTTTTSPNDCQCAIYMTPRTHIDAPRQRPSTQSPQEPIHPTRTPLPPIAGNSHDPAMHSSREVPAVATPQIPATPPTEAAAQITSLLKTARSTIPAELLTTHLVRLYGTADFPLLRAAGEATLRRLQVAKDCNPTTALTVMQASERDGTLVGAGRTPLASGS
jgi:hypothetical protein